MWNHLILKLKKNADQCIFKLIFADSHTNANTLKFRLQLTSFCTFSHQTVTLNSVKTKITQSTDLHKILHTSTSTYTHTNKHTYIHTHTCTPIHIPTLTNTHTIRRSMCSAHIYSNTVDTVRKITNPIKEKRNNDVTYIVLFQGK